MGQHDGLIEGDAGRVVLQHDVGALGSEPCSVGNIDREGRGFSHRIWRRKESKGKGGGRK